MMQTAMWGGRWYVPTYVVGTHRSAYKSVHRIHSLRALLSRIYCVEWLRDTLLYTCQIPFPEYTDKLEHGMNL